MTMQMSDQTDKLAAALAKAQAAFPAVRKSGENKFDRYSYATLEDYVNAVIQVMESNGFSLVTSVDEVLRLEDRTTQKGGTEHAVQVKLTARLIHTSGQWVEASGFGEGQDRADKSIYKAITGARKYALASMLGLATTDDPEADETTGQTPAPKQRAASGGSQQETPASGPRLDSVGLETALMNRGHKANDAKRIVKEFAARFDKNPPLKDRADFLKAIESGKHDPGAEFKENIIDDVMESATR
jgi:hypothetical protein